MTIDHLLCDLIAAAKKEYGEPTYAYFKKTVAWARHGRRPGYHIVPIGDGEPVSMEEYAAGLAESKRCEGEAFMSRLQRSYVRYNKKMVGKGWREILVERINNWEISP